MLRWLMLIAGLLLAENPQPSALKIEQKLKASQSLNEALGAVQEWNAFGKPIHDRMLEKQAAYKALIEQLRKESGAKESCSLTNKQEWICTEAKDK